MILGAKVLLIKSLFLNIEFNKENKTVTLLVIIVYNSF